MIIKILPTLKIEVDTNDKLRCDSDCQYNADGDGEYCYLFSESIYWNQRCEECLTAKELK